MSKNILITGVSQGLGLAIAQAVVAQRWGAVKNGAMETNDIYPFNKDKYDLIRPD